MATTDEIVDEVLAKLQGDSDDISEALIIDEPNKSKYVLGLDEEGESVRINSQSFGSKSVENILSEQIEEEASRANRAEEFLSTRISNEAETRETQYNDLSERITTTESGIAKLNTTIVNYNAYKGTSNAFTLEQVLSDSGFITRCDKGTILTFQSSDGWLKYQFSSSPTFENFQNPNNWKPFVEKEDVEELKEKVDLAAPIVIDWSEGYNMNIFTAIGEYIIKGTRTSLSDNLPVDSLGEIAARLFVVAAVSGNAITQVLVLNNVSGGDGNVYTRTAVSNGDGYVWGAWAKLQSNIDVGQVNTLDNLVDNGIYSGVLTDGSSTVVGSFYDTFVLIVINNYAVAEPLGQQRSISQLKYSLSLDGGISISKRLGTGDDSISWGEWSAIGGGGSADIPMATATSPGLVTLGTGTFISENNTVPIGVIGSSQIKHLAFSVKAPFYAESGSLSLKFGTGLQLEGSVFSLKLGTGFISDSGGTCFLDNATHEKNGGVMLGTKMLYSSLDTSATILKNTRGSVAPLVKGEIIPSNFSGQRRDFIGIPIAKDGGLELTNDGLKVSDSIGGGGSSNNGVKDVTWDSSSNMNNYIVHGVYNITGTRSNDRDNLPITNLGENATIAARLIVTVTPEGATTYRHSVGQTLILSNSEGKETKVYTRNGNRTIPTGDSSYEITWGEWRCLQGMVESYINTDTMGVTAIGDMTNTGLNGMIENGMYSGIYTDDLTMQAPTFVETFVLVVINDYAVSSVAGTPRRISQLKYATDTITGQCTVKKRIGTGGSSISWGDWEEIDTRKLVEKKDVQSSIDDSENPVQSKAIADALAEAVEKGRQLAKRDLYIAAGAEYNDTDEDKEVTIQWSIYKKSGSFTVTHKKGCYLMNGIGDLTEDEVKEIYSLPRGFFAPQLYYDRKTIRTLFPLLTKNAGGAQNASNELFRMFSNCFKLEQLIINAAYDVQNFTGGALFSYCFRLKNLYIAMDCQAKTTYNIFERCFLLENFFMVRLSMPTLNLTYSPYISEDSIVYTITYCGGSFNGIVNERNITIQLESQAYNRLIPEGATEDNNAILAALKSVNEATAAAGKSFTISVVNSGTRVVIKDETPEIKLATLYNAEGVVVFNQRF